MPKVTVIRQETVGRKGAERTVHHLSNGWWINDLGTKRKREHRYSLYKPGVGSNTSHGTFVSSSNNMKKLLTQAGQ